MSSAGTSDPSNSLHWKFKERLAKAFAKTKALIIKHWLPFCILTSLVWALAWPLPGKTLGEIRSGDFAVISTINICIVFFISGLMLNTSDLKRAAKEWKGSLFGVLSIVLITPLVGFVCIRIPFSPPEFAIGLALFAVVPTTLSSGVTMTLQAHGNVALSLLLVVTTNALGIVTVPFYFRFILQSAKGSVDGSKVQINAVDLLVKLIITILVPLVAGKLLLSSSDRVRKFVTKRKQHLNMFNNFNLAMITWQTVSMARHQLIAQDPGHVFLIILGALLLHLFNLAYALAGAWAVRIPKPEAKAITFAVAQRTLPVALTVLSYLKLGPGAGLASIPCIFGQLIQIFIDNFLVVYWHDQAVREEEERKLRELDKGPGPVESEARSTPSDRGSGGKEGVLEGVTIAPLAEVHDRPGNAELASAYVKT